MAESQPLNRLRKGIYKNSGSRYNSRSVYCCAGYLGHPFEKIGCAGYLVYLFEDDEKKGRTEGP